VGRAVPGSRAKLGQPVEAGERGSVVAVHLACTGRLPTLCLLKRPRHMTSPPDTSPPTRAIVWFRRDLRLADNPALERALAVADEIIPVYIDAPDEDGDWPAGPASRTWLGRSLAALDASLRERGARLLLRRGPSQAALDEVLAETGATLMFCNRLHEPAAVARDRAVLANLQARGIHCELGNSALLFEPSQILTGQGRPYRVFTPFWRSMATRLDTLPAAAPAPARIRAPALPGEAIEALFPPPQPAWDSGFWEAWLPGERGANEVLDDFIEDAIADYPTARDRPDQPGTSRLSPHLHFGEISPRQVIERVREPGTGDSTVFVRELGWREFAHHLLFHFPESTDADLNPGFAQFDWATPDPVALRAWQRGNTGIPLIDAGMRQLWSQGWMHNRVRMLVASFLTKHLRYHWRHGARWFWHTLVDADLANNSLGWQWSAGTGVDAAPYFRVFNPVTQGLRFDPDGVYVRHWVPELRGFPAAAIHAPWEHPELLRRLAPTYPSRPLVDLREGREQALAAYARLRAARGTAQDA
jgi:deoxyribodipyrimidine photo-lyase